MPELPEVETIRRILKQGGPDFSPLPGRQVTGGQVFWPRTLAVPDLDQFEKRIAGQVVQDIGRRGKFLIFCLDRDSLLLHLRMSGDVWVEADGPELPPYTRLLLRLDEGQRLVFTDARKFGRAWLVSNPGAVLSGLGPEPLDESFTPTGFFQMLHEKKRQLKPLLLDQTFLAGLGNIYTDEALHLARLHPLRLSNQVSQEDAFRLWAAIRQVLEEGIQRNGASIDWVYRGGDFQNYFRVYQRTGKACPICGTTIERFVIGQRGTHICPNCQRM